MSGRPIRNVVFAGICGASIVGGCTEFVVTRGAWCAIGAAICAFGIGMLLEASE